MRTWPHSFHLLAPLSIYCQVLDSYSVLLETPGFKVCLFLNSSNKKFRIYTLVCLLENVSISEPSLLPEGWTTLTGQSCIMATPLCQCGIHSTAQNSCHSHFCLPKSKLQAFCPQKSFVISFKIFLVHQIKSSIPKYFSLSRDLPFKTNRREKP